MASRLLRVSAALRLLPAAASRAAPARCLAVPGGLATDEEQATGLERKVLEAMNKGLDPYSMFRPKRYAGTKEEPKPRPPPSPTSASWAASAKRTTAASSGSGCTRGEAQRCPSCGAYYKLIPHELPH
ncbi:unnamed protein product [Bubo scandiacus]